jgi:hypothetical protein
MANFQLILGEDFYFLRCGDKDSDAVPYGEPLYANFDGARYLAMVDVKPRSSEVESVLDEWVTPISSETCDVEIVEEDDAEEIEGEEDGEEEEEPINITQVRH